MTAGTGGLGRRFDVDSKVVEAGRVDPRETKLPRHAASRCGDRQVSIPGDPERKTRSERTRNGIPLPDDTWAAIVNTAREVGVSEVSIQRATA
jgi:uncharacterized oxidoreductase